MKKIVSLLFLSFLSLVFLLPSVTNAAENTPDFEPALYVNEVTLGKGDTVSLNYSCTSYENHDFFAGIRVKTISGEIANFRMESEMSMPTMNYGKPWSKLINDSNARFGYLNGVLCKSTNEGELRFKLTNNSERTVTYKIGVLFTDVRSDYFEF